MLIKAITQSYVSQNAVEHSLIFDNVQHLDVSDTFALLVDQNGETGDAIVIQNDGVRATNSQQQYVRLSFFENGNGRIIYSALPVYVMNDSGKTVQSYHPVNVPMSEGHQMMCKPSNL